MLETGRQKSIGKEILQLHQVETHQELCQGVESGTLPRDDGVLIDVEEGDESHQRDAREADRVSNGIWLERARLN